MDNMLKVKIIRLIDDINEENILIFLYTLLNDVMEDQRDESRLAADHFYGL